MSHTSLIKNYDYDDNDDRQTTTTDIVTGITVEASLWDGLRMEAYYK